MVIHGAPELVVGCRETGICHQSATQYALARCSVLYAALESTYATLKSSTIVVLIYPLSSFWPDRFFLNVGTELAQYIYTGIIIYNYIGFYDLLAIVSA